MFGKEYLNPIRAHAQQGSRRCDVRPCVNDECSVRRPNGIVRNTGNQSDGRDAVYRDLEESGATPVVTSGGYPLSVRRPGTLPRTSMAPVRSRSSARIRRNRM